MLDKSEKSELQSQELRKFDAMANEWWDPAGKFKHVQDQQVLIDTCCQLCNDDGLFIMATLNRTWKSWLFGIVGAEYVLRLLPRGTHDWRYFVKPDEFSAMLKPNGFRALQPIGLTFNPFTKQWRTSTDTQVNYLLAAVK